MGGVEQMIESMEVLEGLGSRLTHLRGVFFFFFSLFSFFTYTVTTKLISTLHEEVQNIVMYICNFIFAHYLT